MTIYSERAWERAFFWCSGIVGIPTKLCQEQCVGQSPFLLYGIRYRLSPAGWMFFPFGDTSAMNECAKVLSFFQTTIDFIKKYVFLGKISQNGVQKGICTRFLWHTRKYNKVRRKTSSIPFSYVSTPSFCKDSWQGFPLRNRKKNFAKIKAKRNREGEGRWVLDAQ